MPSSSLDRKSTRLNSSHLVISYAVFFLKSEEHTSELQSPCNLVCRLLLEKKKYRFATFGMTPDRFAGGRHQEPRAQVSAPPRRWKLTHFCFFFNVRAPTESNPFSLQDVLPI